MVDFHTQLHPDVHPGAFPSVSASTPWNTPLTTWGPNTLTPYTAALDAANATEGTLQDDEEKMEADLKALSMTGSSQQAGTPLNQRQQRLNQQQQQKPKQQQLQQQLESHDRKNASLNSTMNSTTNSFYFS